MKFIGTVPPSDERVQVAMEELADFKSVWAELEKVWSQIDNLREQPWVSVQPRKVFQLRFIFSCFGFIETVVFFVRGDTHMTSTLRGGVKLKMRCYRT